MTNAKTILSADDPNATSSRRLTIIAEQLAGMLNGDELAPVPHIQREIGGLVCTLMEIAGGLRTRRRPDAPSCNVIRAIRAAQTDSDLADAWIETRDKRLKLPAPEQGLVIMEMLDRMVTLAMDDGR